MPKLQAAGIGHAGDVRLPGDAVFADASGDGGIDGHAGGKAVVGDRVGNNVARWEFGGFLNFRSVGIAQRHELSRTLEIVEVCRRPS